MNLSKQKMKPGFEMLRQGFDIAALRIVLQARPASHLHELITSRKFTVEFTPQFEPVALNMFGPSSFGDGKAWDQASSGGTTTSLEIAATR